MRGRASVTRRKLGRTHASKCEPREAVSTCKDCLDATLIAGMPLRSGESDGCPVLKAGGEEESRGKADSHILGIRPIWLDLQAEPRADADGMLCSRGFKHSTALAHAPVATIPGTGH